jgi:hypothetical protein
MRLAVAQPALLVLTATAAPGQLSSGNSARKSAAALLPSQQPAPW